MEAHAPKPGLRAEPGVDQVNAADISIAIEDSRTTAHRYILFRRWRSRKSTYLNAGLMVQDRLRPRLARDANVLDSAVMSRSPKNRAEEFLRRAAEHEKRAAATSDLNQKAIFRALAEQYRRLAEQAAHGPDY